MITIKHDVGVIGLGRVGLPLLLSLKKAGIDVHGYDRDYKVHESLANIKMPFDETGCQELLDSLPFLSDSGFNLKLSTSFLTPNSQEDLPPFKHVCNTYIITVGTPLLQHIETDTTQIQKVMDDLLGFDMIQKGCHIILRSTVAPGTTEWLIDYIVGNSKLRYQVDFIVSHCPERIVEGKALEELKTLPQIIGVDNNTTYEEAAQLFSIISTGKMIKASFIEAELAKLFTNIYRYINFAIPNYFAYVANTFDVDIYNLFEVMNTDYSRNKGLMKPGFASGTCLRKDFGMINEHFPQTDLLLQAYKINEYMPLFYVNLVKESINRTKIGILGYSFKQDTDDVRDSLTPKLIRYIEKHVPKQILVNEPNIKSRIIKDEFFGTSVINFDLDEVLNNCDVLFIAMNHSFYKQEENCVKIKEFADNHFVVDCWNLLGEGLLLN